MHVCMYIHTQVYEPDYNWTTNAHVLLTEVLYFTDGIVAEVEIIQIL